MSKINKEKNQFGAYLIIKSGYKEETRNLGFRVECENFEEFKECIKAIKYYNAFDYKKINTFFDNNFTDEQKKKMRFTVGREGSPVVYITAWYNDIMDKVSEILKNGESELENDEFHDEGTGFSREIRIWWD